MLSKKGSHKYQMKRAIGLLIFAMLLALITACLPEEIQGPDPCNEGGTLQPMGAAPAATGQRRGVPAWAVYSFTGLETLADKLDYLEQKHRRSAAGLSGVLMFTRH